MAKKPRKKSAPKPKVDTRRNDHYVQVLSHLIRTNRHLTSIQVDTLAEIAKRLKD